MQERDAAEGMVEDCGGFGEDPTMGSRFCSLAYWITYNRLSNAISEQASELIDELEDQAEDEKVRVLWGVIIDETIEILETI